MVWFMGVLCLTWKIRVTSSICPQKCYCLCLGVVPCGCPRRAEREKCEEDSSVCASAAAMRGNCFPASVSLVS